MTTLLLGVNHNTASVDVREKVAFSPEKMAEALQELQSHCQVAEAVIVSTCNRTELYCVTEDTEDSDGNNSEAAPEDISGVIADWLSSYHSVDIDELGKSLYVRQQNDMVRHLMRVACGLDSMVLGEPQILGQIKSAYMVARDAGTVGSTLMRLFEDTFSVAKQVRTETAIGENPVSVAFAAVSLAQKIFSDMASASALLIGAGNTIELVIQHLHQQKVKNIVVANRTLENAMQLHERYGVKGVLLSDIQEQLAQADIVVSSTASPLPILGKGAVERALKLRKHRPIFMVDLAVPRDIEPEVGELADVYLYTVDDLREVIDSNLETRQSAAQDAESIIEQSVLAYEQKLRSLGIVSTLRMFREKAENIRDSEVERALKLLERGESPEKVLESMARLLTNKLIHAPSVQMKKASADGHSELILLAQRLFELEDERQNTDEEQPPEQKS